jgi:hypothetical protein
MQQISQKVKKYTGDSDSGFQLFKRQKIYRETGEVYLDRTIIIRCFLGAIMFHKIYLTDNDCLHDHPWGFMSVILKGGYVEHTKTSSRLYGAGSILFRKPEFAHRLEVWQPTWTLVFTTKKVRDWGFHTPKGWLRWFNYKSTNSCE